MVGDQTSMDGDQTSMVDSIEHPTIDGKTSSIGSQPSMFRYYRPSMAILLCDESEEIAWILITCDCEILSYKRLMHLGKPIAELEDIVEATPWLTD